MNTRQELHILRDHCRDMAARPRIVNTAPDGTVTTVTGPTRRERDLWTRLADEIDAYLTNPDHELEEPLWH